ncbi:Yip1 family protein [Bacillus cytotoxicus]|uniref:Yip1 family protein n=1 Tax=Bacillus cereus group sp. BfR-BA-01492 TaxID=2920361 RepID=UPI001F5854BD|nr:Yip1 family protein [Bacillus cereus group sp. BfR-BA-01492]EMA6342543.1 YIP1 family protein [Bacillus cytotoxicus]
MEPNINTQDVSGKKPSLFGMITSPSVQFERMKTKSPVWGAFFLFIIITAIVTSITMYQAMTSPEVLANVPNPEAAKMAGYFGIGLGAIGGIIGTAFWFFVAAGVYKIIMMFMSNDTPYMKVLSIYLYTYTITILGAIVNLILKLIIGGSAETSYTSLAPLFEPGTYLHGAASAFEVFSIWGLVVMGLGLQIVAGLSKKQATILIVIFFILSVAFSSLSGIGSSFSNLGQ